MGIAVAAAEEDGRAGERARVISRRSRRTDEAAGEPDHGAVAPRVASREFEAQTGPLGKTQEDDALGRHAVCFEPRDHLADAGQP